MVNSSDSSVVRSRQLAKRRTTLIFLYGPPAVGKLTVAKELGKLTGFKVFHNQLTVDLVKALFDWGTSKYSKLVDRYRLELLEAAARHRLKGVIFTYAYCDKHDKAKVRRYVGVFKRRGGQVLFVRLLARRNVLLQRVGYELRRRHDKITSRVLLNRVLREHDFSTPVPFGESYTVDTSERTPPEVARSIVRHYKLPRR